MNSNVNNAIRLVRVRLQTAKEQSTILLVYGLVLKLYLHSSFAFYRHNYHVK